MKPSSSKKVGTPIPLYFPLSPQSTFLDKDLIEAGSTVRAVLSIFPGSEVAFCYVGCEPTLEAQTEHLRYWNEWMSVLAEDRAAKARTSSGVRPDSAPNV